MKRMMDRTDSVFNNKKKEYISPKISEVAITPRVHLMEGSYHSTLGHSDAGIDEHSV